MHSQVQQDFCPHREFADVYADLHGIVSQRLRSPTVSNWLNDRVRSAPQDGIERARHFWASEGWTDSAIGPTVGRFALSGGLATAVCWFLAVRSGDTVRAVLPIRNWELHRDRMLLLPPSGQSILTQEHVLKTIHATINLSFAMCKGKANSPHDGMLLASLVDGLPLYWGDVRQRGASAVFELSTSDGRTTKFVSGAKESEKHLGLASVLYVPLPRGHSPECVLAFYSPVPHVFGESASPVALDEHTISA